MIFSERKRILRRIKAAPDSVRSKVKAFLESYGYNISKAIDLVAMDEEILVVLYTILHDKAYRPPVDFVTRNGIYHTMRSSRLSSHQQEAIWWLVHREGSPPKALSNRLQMCREQKWRIYSPFYTRPSHHYGRQIGKGLFALVPLLRGQVLCQFTGRLFLDTEKYFKSITHHPSLHYVMQFTHGTRNYVCDPLDPSSNTVTTHFAALINEPSPLQRWQIGEVVAIETSGRNGIVKEYDPETQEYTIELSNGVRQTLDSASIRAHPSRRTIKSNHPRKDVANCAWFDFPVPLTDLYKATDGMRGEEYIYRRTKSTRCTIEYSPLELADTFYGFSDTTGIFTLTDSKAKTHVRTGTILFLKEDVHRGLERYAHVIRVKDKKIIVEHAVSDAVLWRLPDRILVGRIVVSSGPSTSVVHVPFPIIAACSDIASDDEVLCLYGEDHPERGGPCETILDQESMTKTWGQLR